MLWYCQIIHITAPLPVSPLVCTTTLYTPLPYCHCLDVHLTAPLRRFLPYSVRCCSLPCSPPYCSIASESTRLCPCTTHQATTLLHGPPSCTTASQHCPMVHHTASLPMRPPLCNTALQCTIQRHCLKPLTLGPTDSTCILSHYSTLLPKVL